MQDIINRINNKQDEIKENIKFVTTYNGKIIRPKNKSQYDYYKLLENNTIVFALGAAGTGKTYLAVAYAVSMLKLKKVNKIIVTRPIVEAGENLGFLPGELKEKVDPYLIPIYDALHDILGKETTDRYLDKEIVEIAPLAYMRGRTLNDAFVILDEAQNTTSTQMKMFLTRLGYNSKMVITGDESQIDLKPSVKSGIVVASELLKDIEDISCIRFDSKDVVRHPLVSKIIHAYEQIENK
jgi:phosphate starvation-inducible PhoH-like protein